MKKFFGAFKEFIMKGNIIDLAVAFVLGVAFKAIITSLVKDVIMPALSMIFGDEGFENYKYIINPAIADVNGVITQVENAIYYGKFIQSSIDFVIIGFVLFLVVSIINRSKAKVEKLRAQEELAVVVEDPKPSIEEILMDIKGLLVKKSD